MNFACDLIGREVRGDRAGFIRAAWVDTAGRVKVLVLDPQSGKSFEGLATELEIGG